MGDIIPVSSDSMSSTKQTLRKHTKDLGFIPIPKRLQYNSEKPKKFTVFLNYSFGIATTFGPSLTKYSKHSLSNRPVVVMNLYYNQPILS